MDGKAKITAVLGSLLAIYVAVYVVLSFGGRYEPAVIGLNGVKCHMWAPHGFYAAFTWRQTPTIVFLPLYWTDTRLWHTSDGAYSGQYPITDVDSDDIWEYYEAAGLLEQSNGDANSEPDPSAHSAASEP